MNTQVVARNVSGRVSCALGVAKRASEASATEAT